MKATTQLAKLVSISRIANGFYECEQERNVRENVREQDLLVSKWRIHKKFDSVERKHWLKLYIKYRGSAK